MGREKNRSQEPQDWEPPKRYQPQPDEDLYDDYEDEDLTTDDYDDYRDDDYQDQKIYPPSSSRRFSTQEPDGRPRRRSSSYPSQPPSYNSRSSHNPARNTSRSPRSTPPRYTSARRNRQDDYEYDYRPARRSQPQPRPRRVWPVLLTGCTLGVVLTVAVAAAIVITGIYSLQNGKPVIPFLGKPAQWYTQNKTQSVQLSTLTQLMVCDKTGNVTVKSDKQATGITVATQKRVKANSQDQANQSFQQIAVDIQPPGTLSHPLACARFQTTPTATTTDTPATTTTTPTPDADTAGMLTINVVFPQNNASINGSNSAVDLTITLPQPMAEQVGTFPLMNIEALAGNITLDGIWSQLNIKGGTQDGNIKVTHAILAAGSRLSTSGSIEFSGFLANPPAGTQQKAYYTLEGEKQIDISLPENTANVTLDAYATSGKINSQFPLQNDLLKKEGEMVSYHGPLNPPKTDSNAQLTLHVGIGNVNINKTSLASA